MWVHRYNEIRTVQVTRLVSVWLSGGEESGALHKKLDEKIDEYVAGRLEHAVEAVSSIWDLSRKKETPPCDQQLPRKRSWGSWFPMQREQRVRTSLINSIQGGSLLHRKYWARRSRGGSICPIYLPTAVSSLTSSRVATCEWSYILGVTSVLTWIVIECYKGDDGHLEKCDEYEFPEDSDYESERELVCNPISGNAEVSCEKKRGWKLLPVLKIGSLIS